MSQQNKTESTISQKLNQEYLKMPQNNNSYSQQMTLLNSYSIGNNNNSNKPPLNLSQQQNQQQQQQQQSKGLSLVGNTNEDTYSLHNLKMKKKSNQQQQQQQQQVESSGVSSNAHSSAHTTAQQSPEKKSKEQQQKSSLPTTSNKPPQLLQINQNQQSLQLSSLQSPSRESNAFQGTNQNLIGQFKSPQTAQGIKQANSLSDLDQQKKIQLDGQKQQQQQQRKVFAVKQVNKAAFQPQSQQQQHTNNHFSTNNNILINNKKAVNTSSIIINEESRSTSYDPQYISQNAANKRLSTVENINDQSIHNNYYVSGNTDNIQNNKNQINGHNNNSQSGKEYQFGRFQPTFSMNVLESQENTTIGDQNLEEESQSVVGTENSMINDNFLQSKNNNKAVHSNQNQLQSTSSSRVKEGQKCKSLTNVKSINQFQALNMENLSQQLKISNLKQQKSSELTTDEENSRLKEENRKLQDLLTKMQQQNQQYNLQQQQNMMKSLENNNNKQQQQQQQQAKPLTQKEENELVKVKKEKKEQEIQIKSLEKYIEALMKEQQRLNRGIEQQTMDKIAIQEQLQDLREKVPTQIKTHPVFKLLRQNIQKHTLNPKDLEASKVDNFGPKNGNMLNGLNQNDWNCSIVQPNQ